MTQSGKRPPQPGELSSYDTPHLLALYRVACERLRDAGHWSRAPLASEWARALANELAGRGHHGECLRIEQEVRDTEPVGVTGQRKRWEV